LSVIKKIKELNFIRKCKKSGIGVIKFQKKSQNEINVTVYPCYKSNERVLDFLREKYGLTDEPFDDNEMMDFKVNYILNKKPEVLGIPEILFPKEDATTEQLKEYRENSWKRFDEAREFPLEKLDLSLSTYAFYREISKGFNVRFRIICENNSDEIQVRVSIDDRKVNKSEDEQIRRIIDEVTLYKGITKEDIDNKTANYMIYVAAKKYWLERDKSL